MAKEITSGAVQNDISLQDGDILMAFGTRNGQQVVLQVPVAAFGTLARFDDSVNVAVAGALTTLSAAQCRAQTVYLIGTLTANAVVEFLNLDRTWTIIDLTTRGGFTLSIRRTGGDSIVVSPGETVRFRCTG